jgi:DNA invertase Pin-like site-specific DNA recombinase
LTDLLKLGAAYIRVSDERQDEYSPDSQLKRIREYAAKDGYQIPDEYVYYDDGISGRSTRGRDEFKRMISEAVSKDHPFDKLYVWKLSRFSRSMEDSIIYKSMLEKKGVKVVSVSEPISDDIYGKLMERFLEWDAQFYSERLSEEVKRGIAEKIARGEPIVPPPFGYIMKDGIYYPDEENGAANIVPEVFELYASGMKLREIAVLLGNRGVRTKYGNPPDNRWIEYMLRNPCYIGKIRHCPDGSRPMSKRIYDHEKILVVDGHHEPLISLELWEKVQTMLDTQKMAYPKYARREQPIQYMLKGLVRCSSCGATLAMASTMSGKSQIHTLQCCNYARGACHTSHSITMAKIEAAFMEGLQNSIDQKNFMISPDQKRKRTPDQINFDKLIAVEERRLERAKEAYLAEIDTLEQYKHNKEEISSRINALIARRDESEHKEIDLEAFARKVAEVAEFIKREDIAPSAKNEMLHTIIDKIVYEKSNGNLAIYFHTLN